MTPVARSLCQHRLHKHTTVVHLPSSYSIQQHTSTGKLLSHNYRSLIRVPFNCQFKTHNRLDIMGPDQTRPIWLPVDQIYAPSYERTHLGTAKSFNTVNMEPEEPLKNDAWCYEGTYLGKAKKFQHCQYGTRRNNTELRIVIQRNSSGYSQKLQLSQSRYRGFTHCSQPQRNNSRTTKSGTTRCSNPSNGSLQGFKYNRTS